MQLRKNHNFETAACWQGLGRWSKSQDFTDFDQCIFRAQGYHVRFCEQERSQQFVDGTHAQAFAAVCTSKGSMMGCMQSCRGIPNVSVGEVSLMALIVLDG